MTREQLEMMVFLISGNCKGVELLMRMLEEKEEGIEEEVGQSLRLLMVDPWITSVLLLGGRPPFG